MKGFNINHTVEEILNSTGGHIRKAALLTHNIIDCKRSANVINQELISFVKYAIKRNKSRNEDRESNIIRGICNTLLKAKSLSELGRLIPFMQFLLEVIKFRGTPLNSPLLLPYMLAYFVCKKEGTQPACSLKQILHFERIKVFDIDAFLHRPLEQDSVSELIKLKNNLIQFGKISSSIIHKAIISEWLENEITKPTTIKAENRFYVLKRYGSIYPAILEEPNFMGGGYYFRWQNKGFVVDPGYHFWRQFWNRGFSITDIDIICVTHLHDDHIADLEKLGSILHKYNKKPGVNLKKSIMLLASQNVISKYGHLSWSKDTKMKSKILPKGELGINLCQEANHELKSLGIPAEIWTFYAYHDERPYYQPKEAASVGLLFRLFSDNNLIVKIAFSGDTRYDPVLIQQYIEAKPDILVLNLGNLEKTLDRFNESHLGFFGCAQIIIELSKIDNPPKLILLSECGVEWSKYRIILSEELKKMVNLHHKVSGDAFKRLSVLPADNSLIIDIDNLKIITYDNKLKNIKDVKTISEEDIIKYI